MSYAARTDVPTGRSRDAITALLRKHGAGSIAVLDDPKRISLAFVLADRNIRFTVPLRAKSSKTATEQDERSRWRALLLVVRGRLESVETGISTFEEAFLANVVLPDGSTVAEQTAPSIAEAYALGAAVPLLRIER